MTILENTMSEVINEYKKTIETLTNRVSELEENQNYVQKMLDSIYVKETYGEFVDFLNILYKYKEDFLEFVKIKDNSTKDSIKNVVNEEKDIENNTLRNELDLLKKKQNDKEQELYDNIREEIKDEYIDEIDRLKYEKDNISINNDNKIDELIKQINNLTNSLENSNNKIIEIQDVHKKDLESLKSEYENKLTKNNKKEVPLPTPSNSNENRSKFCISDYCGIKSYNEVDHDVKKDIMKELLVSIKMYSDIYVKIKDMPDTNKIIDWLIKNRHIKYFDKIDKNRYRVINKYKRSYILYKKFEDDLQYVYFSFSKMTRIADKYWDEWMIILSSKIYEEKIKNETTKNGGVNNSK
jgi:vacuolar-type H+-ATPase subunit I/STV1